MAAYNGETDIGGSLDVETQQISTFAFFDLESTGLPGPNKEPRITELSVVCVHREALFSECREHEPRVLSKLTLCAYPMENISYDVAQITGLYNEDLFYEKDFDAAMVDILDAFLQRQAPPVCLVAHNGHAFDFPLLQAELGRIGRSLARPLLCVDSLQVFQTLDDAPATSTAAHTPVSNKSKAQMRSAGGFHARKRLFDDCESVQAERRPGSPTATLKAKPSETDPGVNKTRPSSDAKCDLAIHGEASDDGDVCDDDLLNAVLKIEKESSFVKQDDEFDVTDEELVKAVDQMCEPCGIAATPSGDLPPSNAHTPKKQKLGYRLGDVHTRVLKSPLTDAHQAEADCRALLRIFHKISREVCPVADRLATPLHTVKPMYTAMKRGCLPPSHFPFQRT